MKKRFELQDEGSSKFWEVSLEGKQLRVCFGKLGLAGQTQLKDFPDEASARLAMAKLIGEKERKGYREASGVAAKRSKTKATAAQAIAAIAPALEKSVRPYVRIVEKPTKRTIPLWASKGGDGRPYLPKDQPWPVMHGRALLPALQIDLAEVPQLPGFPRKGLLSLFWSEDHQDRALCYFPRILRDESKLWTDFSIVPEDTFLYPYLKPVQLQFERREGCVCWGDHRFEELLGEEVVDAIHDSPHYQAVFNHVWKASGGADTRIGGWSNPQQSDPRARKENAAYELQLLQIQNGNFTHNLFIKPGDLKRADFSDVLFYEACD
jgi:uncharacterized protein YwqG